MGRRLLSLLIDWAIATVLALAFFRDEEWQLAPWVVPAAFAAIQIAFLLVVNGTLGQLFLGIRVVPVAGGYLGLWRPVVRTLLLCLAIPALILDEDRRGLHELASGTVLVRV